MAVVNEIRIDLVSKCVRINVDIIPNNKKTIDISNIEYVMSVSIVFERDAKSDGTPAS